MRRGLALWTVVVLAVIGCSSPVAATPRPTSPQTPESTARASTVPSSLPPAVLPGLSGDDLTGNLDDKQFECSSTTEGVAVTSCERVTADGYLSVGAYGTEAGIHTVTAEAQGDMAEDFLGYIATLPFDGNQPDEARQWVADNMGQAADNMFGPAHYTLSSEDGTTTLTISTQQEVP